MPLIEALILGIVQGITEFLPISSSAHLRVIPALLGFPDPGAAYSAVIQLGSVLAVISYFARDLWTILTGSFAALKAKDLSHSDVRLLFGILLGTLPIGILGITFKQAIESPDGPFRSLMVIGGASVLMGVLLYLAERLCKHQRRFDSLGVKDGLLVGLGQAMALIPGCSRSGSTLTFALFMNIKRDDAARFSFLLGIPAITLAGLLELKELLHRGLGGDLMINLAVGLVASTVVSYLSIAWLLKYLREHSTLIFVGYRLAFGLGVICLSLFRVIH